MTKKVDYKFEILNNIGVISEGTKGWKKELNRISWSGGEPKYDIRDWDETHTKCGKGCTFSEEEIRVLKDILVKEVEFLDKE